MKNFFAIFLVIIMLFSSLSVTASAGYISNYPLTEEELQNIANIPSTLTYTPCTGGNGICHMYSQGWAYVYDYYTGELLDEYNLYNAWQCGNCNTVMITSGDPLLGTPVGYYVTVACSYDLEQSVIQHVYIDPADIHRCNTVYLSGYKFHNSSLLY